MERRQPIPGPGAQTAFADTNNLASSQTPTFQPWAPGSDLNSQNFIGFPQRIDNGANTVTNISSRVDNNSLLGYDLPVSREIQTDYNEQAIQTDPWSAPLAPIDPNNAKLVEECGLLMALAHITAQNGLMNPTVETMEEVDRVVKREQLRNSVPVEDTQENFQKRLEVQIELDLEEWEQREKILIRSHEVRLQQILELLKQYISQQDERRVKILGHRVKDMNRRLKTSQAKFRAQRVRDLRKTANANEKEMERIEKSMRVACYKREPFKSDDTIKDHYLKTSGIISNLVRDGKAPPMFSGTISLAGTDLKTKAEYEDFISRLPPGYDSRYSSQELTRKRADLLRRSILSSKGSVGRSAKLMDTPPLPRIQSEDTYDLGFGENGSIRAPPQLRNFPYSAPPQNLKTIADPVEYSKARAIGALKPKIGINEIILPPGMTLDSYKSFTNRVRKGNSMKSGGETSSVVGMTLGNKMQKDKDSGKVVERPSTPSVPDRDNPIPLVCRADAIQFLVNLIRMRSTQNRNFISLENAMGLVYELRLTTEISEYNRNVLESANNKENDGLDNSNSHLTSLLHSFVAGDLARSISNSTQAHITTTLRQNNRTNNVNVYNVKNNDSAEIIKRIFDIAKTERKRRETNELQKRREEEKKRLEAEMRNKSMRSVHKNGINSLINEVIRNTVKFEAQRYAHSQAVRSIQATAEMDRQNAERFSQDTEAAGKAIVDLLRSRLVPDVEQRELRQKILHEQSKYQHAVKKAVDKALDDNFKE